MYLDFEVKIPEIPGKIGRFTKGGTTYVRYVAGRTYAGFILDRGYFSKENIQYIDKCGYDFVIMVKGMNSFVSDLILENKGKFENSRECNIRQYKTYGMTVKKQLYASDTRERYFHLFYSISLKRLFLIRIILNFLSCLMPNIQRKTKSVLCWITLRFIHLKKQGNILQLCRAGLNLYCISLEV